MKAFDRIFIAALAVIAAVFLSANLLLSRTDASTGRQYRVDAARAAAVIEASGMEALDPADYETLRSVSPIENDGDLLGGDSDYLIQEINGQFYRFDYTVPSDSGRAAATVNVLLGIMALAVVAVLLYVRVSILKPFSRLRELPYDLSKGNLTAPIQEDRHRFFGRFTWGMNMLRQRMEEQKKSELALQAEKKKLILSISHDIKIPLSAIKLYAKALEKGLYGEEKQGEIAVKINEKADEIAGFVSRIVQASNEDFLSLEVNSGEFYFSALMEQLRMYYEEKLRLLNVDFQIGNAGDCLLTGDPDRAVEVLQNFMENAVKYGDGVSIHIRFSDEDDCRLITVENTGCTLSPDELPHIFDSFWRGSNARSEEGSGLGLYICRTLMRQMGGETFAECSPDGRMRVTAVFRKA